MQDAMNMRGSVLDPEQCIACAPSIPDGMTLNDFDNDLEFLILYEESYFVCNCCGWPFDRGEESSKEVSDPPFCEHCGDEENEQ